MKFAAISLILSSSLLAACSDTGAGEAPQTQVAGDPSAQTAPAAPIVALGLTADQLGDADILDSSGTEIAEVERLIADASGTVTALLVEIEDSNPDRYVNIPLDGLTVVRDGDDQDLRGNLTQAQLLAMPAVAR